MTIGELLQTSGIDRADAELLVAAAMKKSRTWVIAHADDAVDAAENRKIAASFLRRQSDEPVSYITGEKEFFKRMFSVTPDVLIPRPSTELLAAVALEMIDHPHDRVREAEEGIAVLAHVLKPDRHPFLIADIGTGSGCIAITLALERPDLQVIATDVSVGALTVARRNADLHAVAGRMRFLQGEDLRPVQDVSEPFLLVSNPPYISVGTPLMRDVAAFEPHAALFAGADGLAVLLRICRQARAHPQCVGVVLECQQNQVTALLKELKD
ncbi:MAG: ribosomal protein L11 methyltransferase [Candidatus Peribacter riflensis]|uniref:peptide chain release factor N(5)-glutamine methyltransferase n=1 Tax=Candidatus Peribacter riflensis TaxID=1735162 RepID=A0A0S1SP30_9BACT|nr:MAG: ribosomal protein L11 methyltransferase [Candidatus Peribacter riflensis]OGJ76733.1 MAG: protein-(glutamine-N5) methyltransferase, release factor-specific [Candidatus Peribacteria bacterium RIFOXYB1_FULL_57_12]OGJ82547.1 MAG: protein-(glutamine-N5) methyltransferase, release factor-specific [Candidatus Peribacteria bacterium RIFOXYC1_FULL_58_8]ALM10904.1 MAG: ribosomal protein L11 methyltransferase [Candidatus Peribacter riflensis]ALM12007.1 MAG: ribosomal protein L11 methyltransferase 